MASQTDLMIIVPRVMTVSGTTKISMTCLGNSTRLEATELKSGRKYWSSAKQGRFKFMLPTGRYRLCIRWRWQAEGTMLA